MLARLAANDPDGTVEAVLGDMVDDLPEGPFDVVLIAYNTVFNLLTVERQRACLSRSAEILTPGGSLVVEAIVPHAHHGSQVSVRTVAADRVVLSVSVHDAGNQRADAGMDPGHAREQRR